VASRHRFAIEQVHMFVIICCSSSVLSICIDHVECVFVFGAIFVENDLQ
jgi:hypothetical protein